MHSGDYFRDVAPPPLTERHLANSRILPDRESILSLMPQGGVCAEIGAQTGYFSKLIFNILQPEELHLFDRDFVQFDAEYFEEFIRTEAVKLHAGTPSALLAEFPDNHFDFIYIDGDHSYHGVRADLLAAVDKIKETGYIACNDYTIYSPLEQIKYGVSRAVNEVCLDFGFEIVYMGLHYWGYHDVVLKLIR